MTNWLVSTGQAAILHLERLKAVVYVRFRELHLLPPTPDRIERLIHSACAPAEQQLSAISRMRLDTLLISSLEAEEENEEHPLGEMGEDAEGDEETVPLDQMTWHDLKLNPGPVGVKSVRQEIAKLRTLEHLKLPEDLFSTVPTAVLSRYRQRAATETLHELRRHPDATRYALLAAFCRLLGFQLMPHLKNIYEQKLCLVDVADAEQYPQLRLILSRAINWDLIRQQYD